MVLPFILTLPNMVQVIEAIDVTGFPAAVIAEQFLVEA